VTESHGEQRDSKAFSADLITDPIARAEREASNGLRQYDLGLRIIEDFVYTKDKPFKLRLSMALALHRAALDGISAYAGNFRPAGVKIEGSRHEPPGAHLVAERVEEMCDYVNDNWSSTAVHLAAYIMWRLNWIHPFADGNGRTSRILSYVVLCIRSGLVLPGTNTIPEQIAENRNPYFEALDAADAAFRDRKIIDVSAMERLLEGHLAKQLASAYYLATGGSPSE
jgi:Fic family protein